MCVYECAKKNRKLAATDDETVPFTVSDSDSEDVIRYQMMRGHLWLCSTVILHQMMPMNLILAIADVSLFHCSLFCVATESIEGNLLVLVLSNTD